MLHMLDKWTEYLENGGQIDAVCSDFKKAFDKVPHTRLLSKLFYFRMALANALSNGSKIF